MFVVNTKVEGVSPLCFGRHLEEEKGDNEGYREFEERVWQQKCHVLENGNVFIPPMAFKHGIAEYARYKGMKVPSKNRATYTKHFEAGIIVPEEVDIGLTPEDAEQNWVYGSSNGQRGGKSRVWKCFPLFKKWGGEVKWIVLDDEITRPVFELHLEGMGQIIGLLVFRPRNGGYFGRFKVNDIAYEKM